MFFIWFTWYLLSRIGWRLLPLEVKMANILYINHARITAVLGRYPKICDANLHNDITLLVRPLVMDILIAVLGWLFAFGLVCLNTLMLCYKWHSKTGQEITMHGLRMAEFMLGRNDFICLRRVIYLPKMDKSSTMNHEAKFIFSWFVCQHFLKTVQINTRFILTCKTKDDLSVSGKYKLSQ